MPFAKCLSASCARGTLLKVSVLKGVFVKSSVDYLRTALTNAPFVKCWRQAEGIFH